MGSDIFYDCPGADRNSVRRLVNIIARWADERNYSYYKVNLPGCTLDIRGKERKVDLQGIYVDWLECPEDFAKADFTYIEFATRGQFVFDFAKGGELESFSIDPKDYKSNRQCIKTYFHFEGGYWRSLAGNFGIASFLTWCKIRYLPQLTFGSDYGECESAMKKYFHDEEVRQAIAGLDDDAFYNLHVRENGIFYI